MKIVFVLLSGQRYELEEVTCNTTLRDVKRFFESQVPSFTRDSYKLSIAGRTGECNVDSLMKFQDYLRQVHRLDFDEESTIMVHPLRYNRGVSFFSTHYPRTIPTLVGEDLESNLAIDLLTLEPIQGLPVKINGRFYDFDAFSTYLANEKEKYKAKKATGKEHVFLCPIRMPLPEILQENIKDSVVQDEIEPSIKHSIPGLRSLIQLEEYEDLIASLTSEALSKQLK